MNIEDIIPLLEVVNTGGIVGLLITMVYLFMKGHIVPRTVYDEITLKIVSEMSAQIIKSVDNLFKEEIGKLKEDACEAGE